MNPRDIDARIARALGRIRLAFRAVLTALTTGGPVALLQADAMAGETLQDNEMMQHYGFTSAPPAGTMCIVLPIGGQTAHGVIVATEHATYRVKNLAGGEVCLYTHLNANAEGHRIHFKADGSIEVAAKNITVKASETARIEGDVVKVHAASKFQFDCNGHGQQWLPDRVNTWQIGAVAGTANAIAPPEIP
jgi:phage baseplate assembly protein V